MLATTSLTSIAKAAVQAKPHRSNSRLRRINRAVRNLNAIDTTAGGNDVAVGNGNVYVGNHYNVIEVIAAGATSPTSSLTDGNLDEIYSIGVDSSANAFDTGCSTSGGSIVDELPGSSSTPTTLPIAGIFRMQ